MNTYAGVVIPGLASIFGIFLVRQYALSIPQSLLDAARIDGAGELRIFASIVLPLLPADPRDARRSSPSSAPGTTSSGRSIVLTDDRLYTLPVALANLLGEHVQDVELMMAGAVLTVLAGRGALRGAAALLHAGDRHERAARVMRPGVVAVLVALLVACASTPPKLRRGALPKYETGQQTYWTAVGVEGDTVKALVNEDGMIEVGERSFSIEPFLRIDGGLVTWSDAEIEQSLSGGYLPIPIVTWRMGGVTLTETAFAPSLAGDPALFVGIPSRTRARRRAVSHSCSRCARSR